MGKTRMKQEPMPWGVGQMGLRGPDQVIGREKTLRERIFDAAGEGRLRRYQATVGNTTASIVPEGDAYTIGDKGAYALIYGLPVGVKHEGKWRHPAGTAWSADIAGLLESAPFVGKPGG